MDHYTTLAKEKQPHSLSIISASLIIKVFMVEIIIITIAHFVCLHMKVYCALQVKIFLQRDDEPH